MSPAEELMDRHAERLAPDIVEGDIQSADRGRSEIRDSVRSRR
jgi:hypothetical protein